jgi:beta-glucosidase
MQLEFFNSADFSGPAVCTQTSANTEQECGNAIADVLLGDAEPGGRLTQTWPLRVQDTVAAGNARADPGVDGHVSYDEGVFIGYRHFEHHAIAPQFACGHGLSYTRFEHSGLRLEQDTLTLHTTVRNTGSRSGREVVQVCVRDETASVARPPQELKAFAKIALPPGDARIGDAAPDPARLRILRRDAFGLGGRSGAA